MECPMTVLPRVHTCLSLDLIISMLNSIKEAWASLVVQWLRICLPMQGTWAQVLVQEDLTCCRATKPVHHNY